MILIFAVAIRNINCSFKKCTRVYTHKYLEKVKYLYKKYVKNEAKNSSMLHKIKQNHFPFERVCSSSWARDEQEEVI